MCVILDASIGDKDAQVEITKVHNHEERWKTLKVLENSISSKKIGTKFATKYSEIVWNNDDASMDRIKFIKKEIANKNKALEEKTCIDSNSQGDAHDSWNIANIFA